MLSSLSKFFLYWNSKYYALTSHSGQHCLERGLFFASSSFTGICFSKVCFPDVWELLVHLSDWVFLSLPSDEESFHKRGGFFLISGHFLTSKICWGCSAGARDFGGVYLEDCHAGWDTAGVCQSCSLFPEWLVWWVLTHVGIQPAEVTKLKQVSGTLGNESQIQSDFDSHNLQKSKQDVSL